MKNALLILSVAILLFGCTKKEDMPVSNPLQPANGSFSFIYNKKPVFITGAIAEYSLLTMAPQFSYLNILGNCPEGENIKSLYINYGDPQITGSVQTLNCTVNAIMSGDSIAYYSIAGKITLFRFDTLRKFISGTFDANLVRGWRGPIFGKQGESSKADTIHIHSGSFDLPLTVIYHK